MARPPFSVEKAYELTHILSRTIAFKDRKALEKTIQSILEPLSVHNWAFFKDEYYIDSLHAVPYNIKYSSDCFVFVVLKRSAKNITELKDLPDIIDIDLVNQYYIHFVTVGVQ